MAAPNLYTGGWHAGFSWNMAQDRANGVNPATLASEFRRLAAPLGVVFTSPPAGHVNPEAVKEDLGWGLGRSVWTMTAWFSTTRAVNGTELNRISVQALKNAGAGSDTDVARVSAGMTNCGNVHQWWEGAIISPEFSTVCATYGAVPANAPPPPPAGISGLLGRAVAEPVSNSNNAARVGESQPVFPPSPDGGMNPYKVAAIAAGGVLLLIGVGYFVRSITSAVKEVRS